jgi:hypothetical protein
MKFQQYIIAREDAKSLIETNKLVLFFKQDGKLYGAPESSRLVFARMKNPDEDVDEGWLSEADFVAFDLEKALEGEKVQSVFSYKDLKSIKIIDQEKMESLLSKKSKNKEPANLDTNDDPAPDSIPTVAKLGEI